MKTVKILNVDIQNITRRELLENLEEGVLVTPNIDHMVKLQKDKDFYDVYKKSEWVVCDSKILGLFSRLLRRSVREVIPGSSFFTSYYMYHKDDEECKIFLLGAKEGIAAKAMERINKRVGREIVVGAHSPSFGFEKNEEECKDLVRIVNESGANVLLVCVGAPKQEKWIIRYRDSMPNVKLFMALGATIDFEAGTLKRAPERWRKYAMEWLYRFFKEPKRLFRRYLLATFSFCIILASNWLAYIMTLSVKRKKGYSLRLSASISCVVSEKDLNESELFFLFMSHKTDLFTIFVKSLFYENVAEKQWINID